MLRYEKHFHVVLDIILEENYGISINIPLKARIRRACCTIDVQDFSRGLVAFNQSEKKVENVLEFIGIGMHSLGCQLCRH